MRFRPAIFALLASTPLALSLLATSPLAMAPLAAQTRTTPATRPVWPDEGPFTWTPKPTVAEITANDLRTRLYGFAHDSMQGRRIGERGNFVGTEYIAREFKRLGLQPAGDSGTYFQTLPYGPLGFDTTRMVLSINGTPLRARTEWIPTSPSAALQLGGNATWNNVPVVFGGRLGDTTPLDEAAVRGKVVVLLGRPGATAGRGGAPASFVSCADLPDRFGAAAVIADAERNRAAGNAGAAPAGGRRGGTADAASSADMRAQRAGAVGVLMVELDQLPVATINSAMTGRNTMRPAQLPAMQLPAASVSRDVAARLFGKPLDQLNVGTTGSSVSASWEYQWRPSPWPARNVVAVLRGSEPGLADEYVLVGAHNDHTGISTTVVDHDSLRAVNTVTRRQGANDPSCTPTADQQRRIDSLIKVARSIRPPRRDSIMNGADDDGSGTVVLLEIAEKFAKERPRRSIIFVSHQGEESGLLGSAWFVNNPTVPLEKIVAAHNMDMVGKGRVEQVRFGGPNSVQMLGARRLSREFGDVIDSVNAISKEPMAIDKSWDVPANPLNRFCRSDQVNYVAKEIPVTYFSLGYAQDYHMVTDEPQYIDYDHSARLGRFIYDVMMALAMRDTRPAISGADPAYPRCGR